MPGRTLRTNARSALRADSLIRTALLAQLAAGTGEVWLVSAWISDVELVDNSDGAFDYLLGEDPPERCRLSDLLLLLARNGSRVRVVTRPTPVNEAFVHRLRSGVDHACDLRVVEDDNVHEKCLVGPGWILQGSMNFTRNGLARNKEQITYAVDERSAAQALVEFQHEWGKIG